jgi:hypothetical protein
MQEQPVYVYLTSNLPMGKIAKGAEIAIFISAIILIFISEYTYVFLKDPTKAIFLGLWPPTILLVLIYFNIKIKK